MGVIVPVPLVWGPRGIRGGKPGWLIDSDEALRALHAAAREAIPPGSMVKVPDVISKALDMYAKGHAEYEEQPKGVGVVGFVYEIKVGPQTFAFAERRVCDRWNLARPPTTPEELL